MSLCMAAQRHSLFLGLPLGGDRDEFVDSLEEKGFEFEDEDNECTTLTGLFDGIGAKIEVHATPRSHTVHLVTVWFVEIGGNEIGLLMKTNAASMPHGTTPTSGTSKNGPPHMPVSLSARSE